MTVLANTIQNVARVGVREDLSEKIAELFPDETPFINSIGRSSANNTYTEWQTDVLAAADETNAAIQGDDLSNASRANTTRVGNHTQIFTKVVGASTTVEWTNKAGRKSELARELMKAGREMQTDIEKRACGNYASVAAAAGVAGKFGGALGVAARRTRRKRVRTAASRRVSSRRPPTALSAPIRKACSRPCCKASGSAAAIPRWSSPTARRSRLKQRSRPCRCSPRQWRQGADHRCGADYYVGLRQDRVRCGSFRFGP
jgi:hypothetical protein